MHCACCVVSSRTTTWLPVAAPSRPSWRCVWAKEIGGVDGYCLQRYAEAMEVIPYTLAENAALNPIEVVTELRKRHNAGEKHTGINVRKAGVSDMAKEEVFQPLLVSTSMLTLATETVRSILKIDDIVNVMG